jgi:hypothetical protein
VVLRRVLQILEITLFFLVLRLLVVAEALFTIPTELMVGLVVEVLLEVLETPHQYLHLREIMVVQLPNL